MNSAFAFFLLVWAAASGCSHVRPASTASEATASTAWTQTSIDIHYMLRHSNRRLVIQADDKGVHGRSLVDGSELKQCQIDILRYQEFLIKTREFVERRRSIASERNSQNPDDCRAPYMIMLKNPKDTVEIQGCRVQDEGAFSHLVQDGEFLIYRQK